MLATNSQVPARGLAIREGSRNASFRRRTLQPARDVAINVPGPGTLAGMARIGPGRTEDGSDSSGPGELPTLAFSFLVHQARRNAREIRHAHDGSALRLRMTRLAVISDVHADLHALRDALAQAKRMGCSAIVCCGDLVDYGAYPDETIELLQQLAVPCVRGNHDRWAVTAGATNQERGVSRLRRATMRYLSELPTTWNAVIDDTRVAAHHGTPGSDMDGLDPERMSIEDAHRWLDQAAADVLLVGHTHRPFTVAIAGGALIANPGALLRTSSDTRPAPWILDPDRGAFIPAPASEGGTFGVLDTVTRTFTVHRASDGSPIEIARRTLHGNASGC